MPRYLRSLFCAMFFAPLFAGVISRAQERPIVLKASTILDGKGQVLRNTIIVVEGGKIARIGGAAPPGAIAYDLAGLTVSPGWIDAHVHPTWHFDVDGRLASENEPKEQTVLAAAVNSWKMLAAGFTTVQSLGSPLDKDLRDAIDRLGLPGPRILTSLDPIFGRGDATGTPDELRAIVQRHAKDGADVIKIFASGSIREGGKPTLSQDQLNAICGEAKKVGLRSVVHAYGPSVRMASLAGCTQVEHGLYATDDDLRFLTERGTYFDPQAGLVIQNYLDNKSHYLGIGNYTEAAFEHHAKGSARGSGIVPPCHCHTRAQSRVRNRCRRRRARPQRRGVSLSRADLRAGPHGGAGFRQLTGRRSHGPTGPHRLDRSRARS